MAKKQQKSKNYNKHIICDLCGKKIRDDRLQNHQKSKNCKTENVIYSVDQRDNASFKKLLRKNGFKVNKQHISIKAGRNRVDNKPGRFRVEPGRNRVDSSPGRNRVGPGRFRVDSPKQQQEMYYEDEEEGIQQQHNHLSLSAPQHKESKNQLMATPDKRQILRSAIAKVAISTSLAKK